MTQFKTVINFCSEKDDIDESNTCLLHFPFLDKLNVYDIDDISTKIWCNSVLEGIADSAFPLVFHCFSGKDRTGVIAAILQKIFCVSDELILQDYCNSDGELSPQHFEEFLIKLNHFLSNVDNSIIDQIISKCSVLPQKMRLRGGYLPRYLTLSFVKDGNEWQYNIDGVGRLHRIQGILCVSDSVMSKRLAWNRISAFSEECCQLQEQNYMWVPAIPQVLGGVNSPFNEVLMRKRALEKYRLKFEMCRRKQFAQRIDIVFEYESNDSNIAVGLQKPTVVMLEISDENSEDSDEEGMEIIYN